MERYEVVKIEVADYLLIGITDNNINRVICHMNTALDLEPAELEELANIMCDALNKQV